MSIKTIDNQAISNNGGVEKRIHKGAEKLVFDILQSTQYSNPIPSTIRELATNACDSQREKEIALDVIFGRNDAEDYYITRDGDQYKDSNFDRSYYDIAHLNIDESDIHISYHKNEGIGYCDEVIVKDFGVGLRADRLEGILQLGFSTKRNTSENFGAFGLGAKVALSTGVDFYSIETVHNGKKFKCDCYPYNTKFKYPAFNPYVTFSDGSKVHYEETDELNYTIVSFKVKKHNRNRYVQAVEEQLTYFSNIKFIVREQDGYEKNQNFQADILYNSDTLIVPNNSVHYVPHIVIVKSPKASTGINYGSIDFRELEMEELWGAIGLKCPARQVIKDEFGVEIVIQEGVDVTPSREKVIWNETTKSFVQGLLVKATSEAAALVEASLDEKDLLIWIGKCRAILSRSKYSYSDDTNEIVLAHISKMIDTEAIQPKFTLNPKIRYKSPLELFKGFGIFKVSVSNSKTGSSFERTEIKGWNEIPDSSLFHFQETGVRSPIKDYYILQNSTSEELSSYIYLAPKSVTSWEDAPAKKALESYANILPHLKGSKMFVDYNEVEVPLDFQDTFDKYVKKAALITKSSTLSPKERREQNESVLVRAFSFEPPSFDQKWTKVEPTLYTLSNPSSPLYYGTLDDKHELNFAVTILRTRMRRNPHKDTLEGVNFRSYQPTYKTSYVDEVPESHQIDDSTRISIDKVKDDRYKESALPQVIRVSHALAKKLSKMSQCHHISSFFVKITDSGEYTTSKEVREWWNIKSRASTPTWATTLYGQLDPKFQEFFKAIYSYKSLVDWESPLTHSSQSDLHNYQDVTKYYESFFSSLEQFEEYVELVKDLDNSKELIAAKSAEFFILGDIPGARIKDTTIQEFFKTRDELISDVDVFLSQAIWENRISSTSEFRKELSLYLQLHGKLDIELPQLT